MIMELKDYTCPGCGGVLNVDKALKVYRCQYCGVTYDYNYFMRDDVLDRAYSYLNHSEFKAAKEAFEFILQKEPYNALAYRGLLLVTAGLRDLKDFRDPKVFERLPYKKMKDIVERALENVGDNDRKFFEEFSDLLENGEKFKAAKNLQKSNEKSAMTNEEKADLILSRATNKKENIRAKYFLQTIAILFLLGIILAIPSYFWLNSYRCRISRGLLKAKGYVLDEENDGSVRNEEDWAFISEHDGVRNRGKKAYSYQMPNGDRSVTFYLKNGRQYFVILASIVVSIAFFVQLVQFIRYSKHKSKLRLAELYEQAERVEAEAQKEKDRYESYRNDANLISRELNRSLAEMMRIDPYGKHSSALQ